MDPNGGMSPSNPRLDGIAPPRQPQPNTGVPGVPAAQPIKPPSLDNASPGSIQTPASQAMPSQSTILDTDTTLQDTPPKGGNTLKTVLIIFGIIVLLAALVGGGYYLGYTMGKTAGRAAATEEFQQQQATLQQQEAESADAEPTTDELKLADLKEPKYVDETIEGEIGKQLSASDGFVMKVTNVERNFKPSDPNYKLDTSKELIKINFLMGNVTKEKSKDISSFNFRLEDSKDAQLTPENVANYEGKFDTVKLDPGAQAEGSIVYKVNKNEKPLSFVREQRYRISGENREVTTRIVVVIAKK